MSRIARRRATLFVVELATARPRLSIRWRANALARARQALGRRQRPVSTRRGVRERVALLARRRARLTVRQRLGTIVHLALFGGDQSNARGRLAHMLAQ